MSVSEIYGEFSKFLAQRSSNHCLLCLGCGKTQIAHTMAVIAQLPKVCETLK
jgi:hypothetical protein